MTEFKCLTIMAKIEVFVKKAMDCKFSAEYELEDRRTISGRGK
jgi:hypothetical protein